MSGDGIEAVLADHYFFALGDGRCVCGEVMNEDRQEIPDWHRAHVAAAVLAWLDARLTEGDVVEAVAEVIFERTGRHMPQESWHPMATAALSAVRGVLGGEGSC